MAKPDFFTLYTRLAHKCQSGIRLLIEGSPMHGVPPVAPDCGTPKHLRVGINNNLVEHSALVKLLIANGVITQEQWEANVVIAYEEEVARLEAEILDKTGIRVTLESIY